MRREARRGAPAASAGRLPADLTGRVERIEVRREKYPGLDDVYLVTVADRTIHLDEEVAALLPEGEEVRKAAWSTELSTPPEGSSQLGVSRDFLRMLLAMPLLIGLAIALLRFGQSQGEEEED